LFLVLVLTSWALSVVGTMFSALTVNLRLRELMLPTLVYPIMIPGLLAAIQLTTLLAVGEPLTVEYYPWLRLLTGFDVIYTLLGLALVDTVLVG
jgi:heme exporter protein B